MVQQFSGPMIQWISKPTNQWMNRSVNHWTKEPMNQCILPTSSSKTAPANRVEVQTELSSLLRILPASSAKSAPVPLVFLLDVQSKVLKCKPSSGYSLVCILPTSSAKSAPIPSAFCDFEMQPAFSLQFRVHLADLIFQSAPNVIFFHILPTSCSKSAPTVSFFKHFEVQIKLSPQSCALFPTLCSKSAPASSAFYLKCKSSCHSPVHFLWTTFTARGPEPRKHAPYFGDASSHFTRKSTGFRVRKCFTREFTRFRTVTLPNYTWWWAVDMMMWLTWWWEC